MGTIVNIREPELLHLCNKIIHTIRESLDVRTYHNNGDSYAQDVLSVLGLVCAHEIYNIGKGQSKKAKDRLREFFTERVDYALSIKDEE